MKSKSEHLCTQQIYLWLFIMYFIKERLLFPRPNFLSCCSPNILPNPDPNSTSLAPIWCYTLWQSRPDVGTNKSITYCQRVPIRHLVLSPQISARLCDLFRLHRKFVYKQIRFFRANRMHQILNEISSAPNTCIRGEKMTRYCGCVSIHMLLRLLGEYHM